MSELECGFDDKAVQMTGAGVALRDYQQVAVNRAVRSIRRGERPIVVAPTGAGKSVIGLAIALNIGAARTIVVSHSATINDQWRGFGCVAVHPSRLAALETTAHDLVIIDEAHHYAANTYALAVADLDCRVVGLTATPVRLSDRQTLARLFTRLIQTVSVTDLITAGHLADFDHITPAGRVTGDMDDRTRHTALVDFVRTRQSVGRIVEWLGDRLDGRRAIVFAPSKQAAHDLAAALNGVTVFGDLSTPARQARLTAFRAGEVDVLVTVRALLEGTDLPECDTVVLAAPFGSYVSYAQAVGRALRPAPDKRALILDYAVNVAAHGLVTDPVRFTLRGLDLPACERCGAPDFDGVCFECGLIAAPPASASPVPMPACPLCGRPMKNYTCRKCSESGVEVRAENVTTVVVGGLAFERTNYGWAASLVGGWIAVTDDEVTLHVSDAEMVGVPVGTHKFATLRSLFDAQEGA